MTAPTGHPDWQSYAVWQGTPVIDTFNQSFPPGLTVFGPFSIANFRGVYINHTGLNANHQLNLDWVSDAAGSVVLVNDQFDFHGAESMNVVKDSVSPFYTVSINNLDVAAHNGTLVVAPTNAINAANEYASNAHGRKLATLNQSVAAAGNAQAHSTALYEGPATFAVQQATNGNWHAQLQAWHAANNVYDVLAEIDGATAGRFYVGRVTCPRATMNIQVFNDDAAAQNMIASLVAG